MEGPLRANQLEKVLRGQLRVESTLDELKKSIDRLSDDMRQHRKTYASVPVAGSQGFVANAAGHVGSLGRVEMSGYGFEAAIEEDILELQNHIDASSNVALDIDGDPVDARTTIDHLTTAGLSSEGGESSEVAPRDPRTGYVVHECFQELSFGMSRTGYARVVELLQQHNLVKQKSSRSVEAPFAALPEPNIKWLPLHPTAPGRIAWDCLGIFVLLQDSLSVPVTLAWETEPHGGWLVLAWLLAIFWTVDMVLNFCTGYSEGGKIVRSWRAIARKYFKGGLGIDLAVLGVDYSELLVKAVNPGMSSGSLRVLRFLRFAKITRLVRVLAKLRRGLQTKIDAIWYYRVHMHGLHGYAQYLRLAAMLAKLLIFIAWLSHVGSCVWYFLGRTLSGENEDTWYRALPDRGPIFDYVMGLYWSLSAMFSGASSQLPNTTWEALLSAVCVILGALFVTAITSTLAAILIEAQEVQQESKRKDRLLTTFLEQNSTPVLLALAVRADFLSQVAATPRLSEQDLAFFPLIAPKLRAALRECHYGDHFMRLPTFRVFAALDHNAVQEFCFTATNALVQSTQEVFPASHEVESAILLAVGNLQYTLLQLESAAGPTPRHESRRVSVLEGGIRRSAVPLMLDAGAWLCEMSLFLQWRTCGSLAAYTTCELLVVSAEAFIKVVMVSPEMAAFASEYAAHLAEAFQKDPSINPTDIDSGIDCDLLLAEMHASVRQLVSLPLMELVLQQQNGIIRNTSRKKGLAELEAELLSGKCHLVRAPSGDVHRVVRLVAFKLLNLNGLLCVTVGEWSEGGAKAKFQLPGRKLESNEGCDEALTKILHEEFQDLVPFIRIDHVKTITELEHSPSYGLYTKYIKTIQTATLEAEIQFPPMPDAMAPEPSLPLKSVVTNATLNYSSTNHSSNRSPSTSMRSSSRQSLNGPSPLSTEGDEYAFAAVAAQRDLHIQATRTETTLHLFKWVDPAEFERAKRDDVEHAILPWLYAADESKLTRLTQWTAVPAGEVTYSIVNHDVGPAGGLIPTLAADPAGNGLGAMEPDLAVESDAMFEYCCTVEC